MRQLLPALTLLLLAPAMAQAQEDVAEFYKGKTVRLIVGIGVGSGYDVNARVLARHMGKHIPGNPNIIVQNQPGAGSLTMTNQMYAAGPFDGTVIGAWFNGLPTAPLLQPNGVRFESSQDQLARLDQSRDPDDARLAHRADARRWKISGPQEMIVGAQAAGSTQYDYPMMGKALFGMKFKVVTGYKATSEINLAMERGEVHGTLANWSTVKALIL